MKKGEIVTGTITRVDFPNRGIMTVEDRECAVKNTVPGQKVEARIAKRKGKRGKAEASLVRVLEKAPNETESACPRFGECGGCTYLNIPYEDTLKLKENQVRDLIGRALPEDDLSWLHGILPSPHEYGYRNKMEFSFGDEVKGGPLTLGMHKRGSFYDIVNANGCVITDGDFRKIVRAVRDYWDRQAVPFYHRLRHEGYLRHLLVRKAEKTGEILVDLVTTSQLACDLDEFSQMLQSLELDGTIVGILHTANDAVADVIRNDGTDILYGRDYFYEKTLGLTFKITPFSFFQTNSAGAEVLYETARRYLLDAGMDRGVVYDLYSGTGTIAQLMSPAAQKVIGVEIVPEAVEAARENAARNHIGNCEFIAGDVLEVLDTIEERPDLIILDPPRDGVHPRALPKILRYGVENILYIACKPTSLARDLPSFVRAGYRPVRGCCVDMFPWTANVETVCLLSRENS